MTLKEIFTQNKGKLAFAVLGVTAVGVLAYWFSKRTKSQPTATDKIPFPNEPVNCGSIYSDNSQNNSQHSIQCQQTYSKKFTRIINQCRAIFDQQQQLTPRFIKAIIRGQYQLAEQDIKTLIFKSRLQRRQKIDDPLQYAKLVTITQISLQSLHEKHLGAILSRFNIDKTQWKQACDAWQYNSQGKEDNFSHLIHQQQNKQLLSLKRPNSKPKPFLFIEQYLTFKIKTLEIIHPNDLGIDLTVDDAAKYELIQAYVNDLAYKKFNIQEEDAEYSIMQMSVNDKQKIIALQDTISQLMHKFIQHDEQEKDNNFY